LERQIRYSATSATGTLIQNIECHVHCVRNPPASGPIAVRPPEMPKKTAIARPRSAIGNDATTMPTAAGNISAAKAPWTTRKTIIHAAAMSPVGVNPHNAEATANPITPTTTIRRRPSTSPSLPPNAKSADSASR
jgi:hypothetical protein